MFHGGVFCLCSGVTGPGGIGCCATSRVFAPAQAGAGFLFGIKGYECGTVGALAAGMNAINDALKGYGVRNFQMPATPARVWKVVNGG